MKYAVLYIETDLCKDPKLVSKPVDTREDAMAIAKSLWEAELKKKGIAVPPPDEYGHPYSEDAFCYENYCCLTPYAGANYQHKWLVITVPQE